MQFLVIITLILSFILFFVEHETKKPIGLHMEEYKGRPSENDYWRNLYGLNEDEEA